MKKKLCEQRETLIMKLTKLLRFEGLRLVATASCGILTGILHDSETFGEHIFATHLVQELLEILVVLVLNFFLWKIKNN